MKKWQWIARWVTVALVVGGGKAWAQDDPKPQPTSIHAAAGKGVDFSPALKKTGWVLIVVGAAMTIPAGYEYDIFGHDVCVSRYSVTDGGCGKSALELKVAAVTVATGAAFVLIGGHNVALRPEISTHHKAVSATIRWK